MDALLRQSMSMCPFLKKTSPATLRTLSTSTTPARHVSPGGGSISNLQVLARRCPVMGKAIAVQAAKTGHCGFNGVFGGTRAYGGYGSKAKLHTTRAKHASVAENMLRRENQGVPVYRAIHWGFDTDKEQRRSLNPLNLLPRLIEMPLFLVLDLHPLPPANLTTKDSTIMSLTRSIKTTRIATSTTSIALPVNSLKPI